MHVEVSVGLNFVISYLYNKLPRRRVDFFAEELEKEIKRKFDGHWYPEKPFKGSAFRCIKVSGEKIDPVMELAAISCALDITEIQEYLPKDLTIWIDPNEVSYRIGEKGVVKILYSDRKEADEPIDCADTEVQRVSKSFNPDAQSFRPIETLSTSLNNLNLSPAGGSSPTWGSPSPTHGPQSSGSSPINSYLARSGNNNNNHTFTAASFAQTKFGSTKLKSHAKRPSRLSPTDFTSYVKQRSILQNHWINGVGAVSPIGHGGINPLNGLPCPAGFTAATQQQQQHTAANTLSPRDPRQEFLERQRFLLLQQQQQQQQKLQQQRLNCLQSNGVLNSFGSSLNEVRPSQHHQQQQHHQHIQQQMSPNSHSSSSLLSPFNTMDSNSSTNLLRIKCPSDLGPLNMMSSSNPSGGLTSTGMMDTGILGGSSGGNGIIGQGSGSSSNNSGKQKGMNDNMNWNGVSPYAHLQHLLVAN